MFRKRGPDIFLEVCNNIDISSAVPRVLFYAAVQRAGGPQLTDRALEGNGEGAEEVAAGLNPSTGDTAQDGHRRSKQRKCPRCVRFGDMRRAVDGHRRGLRLQQEAGECVSQASPRPCVSPRFPLTWRGVGGRGSGGP